MVAAVGGIAGGRPDPLGATCEDDGINFAIFSANAEKVELCLFDSSGIKETARLALLDRTNDIWHGFLPGARAGLLYGYRVHGPFDPRSGHRFNANKLLIDPYARALDRPFNWNDIHCGHIASSSRQDLSFDPRDNAAFMPKCRVVGAHQDRGSDRKPANPAHRGLIYELHVRGYTMLHPSVEPALKGTFAGMVNPKIVDHLRDLGVTALELLPINPIGTSRRLSALGLRDYWGYNSLNFFALEPRYLSGNDINEFRQMVHTFHSAGIEIILDMAFNHSGEGDELGPTLSFRGIDNASYYCLAEDKRNYVDYTGCKNTLNFDHPRVRQMIIDAMRYWANEMRIDGFRLDLATSLFRTEHHFSKNAPLMTEIAGDESLVGVKLIAEPWDMGPDGYQLGAFAEPWQEWNDKFRDAARRFWRGDAGQLPDLASRLSGSSDIFGHSGRGPSASINFVAAHDGFTLADLVGYAAKRNEGNGEGNADGSDANWSVNCGSDGPSVRSDIVACRQRQMRNLVATLLLSQGVPMLRAGDEFGQSQAGNNNPYCQDNEISWIDWSKRDSNGAFLSFVRKVIALRRANDAFMRKTFFEGAAVTADGIKDIAWLRPDGGEMTENDWGKEDARTIAVQIAASGEASAGRLVAFLFLLNAGPQACDFCLPAQGLVWRKLLDTSANDADETMQSAPGLDSRTCQVEPQSTILLAGYRHE